MSGALTLEALRQALDSIQVGQADMPETIIVSMGEYRAMEDMPGGPSMDNYMTLLKRRFGITE